VQTIPFQPPELSEERWSAWVQKGRVGDAARVRSWRLITTVGVVLLLAVCVAYFMLPSA
jgi:hypothetical protein